MLLVPCKTGYFFREVRVLKRNFRNITEVPIDAKKNQCSFFPVKPVFPSEIYKYPKGNFRSFSEVQLSQLFKITSRLSVNANENLCSLFPVKPVFPSEKFICPKGNFRSLPGWSCNCFWESPTIYVWMGRKTIAPFLYNAKENQCFL